VYIYIYIYIYIHVCSCVCVHVRMHEGTHVRALGAACFKLSFKLHVSR